MSDGNCSDSCETRVQVKLYSSHNILALKELFWLEFGNLAWNCSSLQAFKYEVLVRLIDNLKVGINED